MRKNLKECGKMSENEGSITIKFDKKMVTLFVVIVVAIATGLLLYKYVMAPAANTAAEKTGEAAQAIEDVFNEPAARAWLNKKLTENSVATYTLTELTREEYESQYLKKEHQTPSEMGLDVPTQDVYYYYAEEKKMGSMVYAVWKDPDGGGWEWSGEPPH
jgi:hypothetical protein